jgi:hypothetical protein
VKVRAATATLLVAASLALPVSAFGKGASEVTLEGQGLDSPIRFGGGEGDPDVMGLAEASGIFPAMFGQSPDPMLGSRPRGDLGPRYVATYVVPSGGGHEDLIRQHVFPYADRGPFTYTPPGQGFFETEETPGGWYRASADLKDRLVDAGLPEIPSRPEPAATDSVARDIVPRASFLVAGLVAAATLFLALRRRPREARSH